ncbi:MAG: Glutamyl-tRNA reductase [Ignavibacteriae bacterium]|nr:MAG: Glutamyl-tRNA reductase [Ignavibacteriota bacterium]
MNLISIGINHRTAPVEVREKIWFSNDEIILILPKLKEKFFKECVLVSTCNRTELYGIPSNELVDTQQIEEELIKFKNADNSVKPEHFYLLHSSIAISHLFKVVSGIDSMILGDVQILNQIKEAYLTAAKLKTVGKLTARLFDTAFHVGKRARSETQIGEGAVSISYAAVELASKIFSDLKRHTALIIGSGETAQLTAKHLQAKNIGKLIFTNRTREKAENLAKEMNGAVIEFNNLAEELDNIDIIISSITIPDYIITSKQMQKVMRERHNRQLFIIDIGVPRNIDPEIARIENVFLYDIDALNNIIDKNLEKRRAEVPKVKKIVFEELEQFYNWYKSLQVNPTIQELRLQFEKIREEEVSKNINRFKVEDRELVDIITKRIINKILHTPIVNLKNGNNSEIDEDTISKVSLIRSLFGLEKKK